MTTPLWTPSPELVATSAMTQFLQFVNNETSQALKDDKELYDWSIDQYPELWNAVWNFCHVIGDKGERLVANKDQMPGCQFFPDARLNYAENLLNVPREENDIALHFWGEDKVKRQMSFAELRATSASRTPGNSRANTRAIASPMPCDAPVTRTTGLAMQPAWSRAARRLNPSRTDGAHLGRPERQAHRYSQAHLSL